MEKSELSHAIYVGKLLLNDFSFMKIHASGPFYLNIVSILEPLIEELEDEIYDMSNEAIMACEKIDNFSNILSQVDKETYNPITEEIIDFSLFCELSIEQINKYIAALEGTGHDLELKFWNKQVNLTFPKMMLTSQPKETIEQGEDVDVEDTYETENDNPTLDLDDEHGPLEPFRAVNWSDYGKRLMSGDVSVQPPKENNNDEDTTIGKDNEFKYSSSEEDSVQPNNAGTEQDSDESSRDSESDFDDSEEKED